MMCVGFISGLKAELKGQKAYKLHGEEKYDEALQLYKEAVDSGLSTPRYLLAYSSLLVRTGAYQEAKELLIKIQKLPTISPEQKTTLFINYAACAYKLGEIEKGIRLLERQHQHAPSGKLYQILGYLYVEKYDQANTPDFDLMERQAAEARAAAEAAKAEAEKAYTAVLESSLEEETAEAETVAAGNAVEEPEQPSPREAWMQQIDHAEAFLKEAIDYDEEDAICLDNYAQFLYRVRGDKEEARVCFDKAIAEKEGQIDTLWFLSRYDLEAGDTAAAAARLRKALEGRFSALNHVDEATVRSELARIGG